MSTAANVRKFDGSHWYWPNSTPCFELPKKSGEGMKRPTIVDARELGLVPSVTTILKTLNRPALNQWITEQSVLAALTTPRNKGETVDEFVHRVFHVEQIQDQEAEKAANRGTDIHEAIARSLNGMEWDSQWKPYVQSVLTIVESLGKIAWSEKILVGDGYAGRADLLVEDDRWLTLTDFKSTGTLPKKDAYDEHKMQVAAYAKALGNTANKHVQTALVYLSTKKPGETAVFFQEDWLRHYDEGFVPAMKIWRYLNDYRV